MRQQIKKYVPLFVMGFGILVIASCTKLQTKVYSVVPSTDYWQTPAQVDAGVAPAYSSGMNQVLHLGGSVMNLFTAGSDEMIVPVRGGDWGDFGHWDALFYHTYEPSNANWNSAWNGIFNGISSCNLIITAVNGLPTKPTTLPSILAQVRTLRAYYYYVAMSLFGNLPIVTDTTTNSTPSISKRVDVYNFIVSELTASLPDLTDEVSSSTYGKVTKYFSYALLARLYLNAQVFTGAPGKVYTPGTADYQNAIKYADLVLAGPYSLMSDYFDNFMPTNGPGSTENIYAWPCDHSNNLNNDRINAISHYQSYLSFGMASGGNLWNGFCSASDFYSTFDTTSTYSQKGSFTYRNYNDQRSGQWMVGQQFIGTYNYPPSQNVVVAGPTSSYVQDAGTNTNLAFDPNFTLFSDPSAHGRLIGARNIKYFFAASAGNAGADMDNDEVVFRLAEVMLIKAEAELRLGTNTDDALNLVNQLRTRAYGSTAYNWTSGQLTLASLLAEKGREMAYEGTRREDVIRYEVAGDGPYFTKARGGNAPTKAADPDQHWMVFPIPALQITANAKLTQTDGY